MDVLCYVILGYNVKDMVRRLKQPQSTISTKLGFLVKNEVVAKDKWKFKPNWEAITKIFQKEIKKCFEEPLEIIKLDSGTYKREKKLEGEIIDAIEHISTIFNQERVIMIFENYADYFGEGWLGKISTSELVKLYAGMIKKTDTNEFKKFKNDIMRIKKLFNKLNIRDMKEDLFIRVEEDLKWRSKENKI